MAAIKTYILAPNFTYRPNTSICLGDIIQDPSDPTRPLSSLPSAVPTESHLDYDARLATSTSSSLNGSVFAKFLDLAEARLGAGVSRDARDVYAMERLETVYFTKQPTEEEAAERVKDARVAAAINAGVFGKKPVYMISALKIARGLRVETGRGRGWNADVGVGVPLAAALGVPLEVGVEVGGGRERAVEASWTVGEDVVFAYQCHVLGYKGWRGGDVGVKVYRSKVAFLNEGGGGVVEEVVEVVAAGEQDVRAFDEEMVVTAVEAREGGEVCVCLVLDDEGLGGGLRGISLV
ncbi:hypothetical protein QBC39DRAFT_383093 [Podospora conica]|nr:hypothetical protein QBC39DRAFT_383093 [Schizothecium conicum]